MKTASTVWLLLPLTAAACSLSTSDFSFDADTAAGGAAGSAGASAGSSGAGNGGSSGTGGGAGGTGGAGAAGKGGAGGGGTAGTGGAGASGSAGKGGGGASGSSGAGAAGTSGSGGTAGVSGGGTGGTAGSSGKGGSAGASGTAGSAGSGPCKDGDTQCNGVDIQTCSGGKFAKTSTCPTDTVCGMQNGKAVCSSCVPDQGKCAGTTLLRCASDGSGFELLETCMGTTPICDEKGNAGKGECDTCAPDSFQCIGPTLFKCNATGQGLVLSKDCGSAALCNASAGTCSTQTCTAGQRTCTNDTPMLCDTAQNKFVADGTACGAGLCNPASNVCFACAANTFRCTGDTLEQCAADGSKWNTQVQCPAGKCDAAMKTCTQCTNGSVTCSSNSLVACQNGSFTPGMLVKTCAANEICDAVGQQCDTCQPGAFRCNGASLMVCNADGQGEAVSKTCGAASLCDAAAGTCKACSPGTFQCVSAGLQRCADDGSAWVDKEACASAALCDAPGQTCHAPACVPGQTGCAPGPKFGTCKADLTGMDFVACASDQACTPTDGCTSPVGGPQSLSSGDAHTCALFGKSGTVFCWGLNGSGQLGTDLGNILGPGPVKTSATDPTPFHDAVALAAGAGHTCALTSNGQVWCWGDNSMGQLGKGDVGGSVNFPTPVALSGETIVVLAAGGQHTCAVTKSGTTYCWGRNDRGQLGIGSQMDTGAPSKVNAVGFGTPVEMSLAYKHTCAVVPTGTINDLWCWGDNTFGELGIGNTMGPKLVPTKIAGFTAAHIITSGQVANTTAHTCAHSGDKVFCWGNDAQGQLGDGAPTAAPTLAASSNVVGLSGVVAADASYGFTCASTGSSTVCWGNCSNVNVCGGPTGAQATPLPITGANGTPLGLSALGVGQHFGCGISQAGVACWGLSNVSQLGSPGGDSPTARLIKLP